MTMPAKLDKNQKKFTPKLTTARLVKAHSPEDQHNRRQTAAETSAIPPPPPKPPQTQKPLDIIREARERQQRPEREAVQQARKVLDEIMAPARPASAPAHQPAPIPKKPKAKPIVKAEPPKKKYRGRIGEDLEPPVAHGKGKNAFLARLFLAWYRRFGTFSHCAEKCGTTKSRFRAAFHFYVNGREDAGCCAAGPKFLAKMGVGRKKEREYFAIGEDTE